MFERKSLFEDEYFDIENYIKEGLDLVNEMLPLLSNKDKKRKEIEKLAKLKLRLCEINLILDTWCESQIKEEL